MNKTTKRNTIIGTVGGILGILVALSTLHAAGWTPVTKMRYEAHVVEYKDDRLDRICKECIGRCHRFCTSQACLESCIDECEVTECR